MTLDSLFYDTLFYKYNRPFQEKTGYITTTDDKGNSVITINALGVNPDDVEVTSGTGYDRFGRPVYTINIDGKTHQEILDKDFSIKLDLGYYNPVQKIIKHFNSGLLTLVVEHSKPNQPDVEIVNG